MKSVYIITGGILVMIAVVFLAPKKQSNTEEKASIPLDEIEARMLKVHGPDLPPEVKEIARREIEEDLAREKSEMRKYGRLLTPDERSTQWWQAQDEAAKQAAYAELYAEQKDWIDNFPFQPRYYQNLAYDPENNIAHSDKKFHAYKKELEKKARERWFEITDKEAREIWARTDLSIEEKNAAENKLWEELEKSRKPDPEIMAERRIMDRHKQLAGFYKQHYRYLPEFEQAYRIFEEEGAGDNPLRIANTMIPLESYFVVSRQANQHGADEMHPYQTRWDPKTKQTQRITWGEQLERDFRCIAGNMNYKPYLLPGEKPLTEEQINRIRDRLVAEIPPDGFTGQTFLFGLMDPKEEDMMPGQSLLAH